MLHFPFVVSKKGVLPVSAGQRYNSYTFSIFYFLFIGNLVRQRPREGRDGAGNTLAIPFSNLPTPRPLVKAAVFEWGCGHGEAKRGK